MNLKLTNDVVRSNFAGIYSVRSRGNT